MDNSKFELLRRLAQEAKQNPNLLIAEGKNYRLYGCYRLIPNSGEVIVVDAAGCCKRFTVMSSAFKYCTAAVTGNYRAALEIINLDQQLLRAQSEINWQMQNIQQNRSVFLSESKLAPAQILRNSAKKQLAKYPTLTKYFKS